MTFGELTKLLNHIFAIELLFQLLNFNKENKLYIKCGAYQKRCENIYVKTIIKTCKVGHVLFGLEIV